MTAQEREMLEYLENLQATNPAEYELLVKEMQQKAAEKKGKGGAAASQGEMVTPTPGFVAKTRSATNGGDPIFFKPGFIVFLLLCDLLRRQYGLPADFWARATFLGFVRD